MRLVEFQGAAADAAVLNFLNFKRAAAVANDVEPVINLESMVKGLQSLGLAVSKEALVALLQGPNFKNVISGVDDTSVTLKTGEDGDSDGLDLDDLDGDLGGEEGTEDGDLGADDPLGGDLGAPPQAGPVQPQPTAQPMQPDNYAGAPSTAAGKVDNMAKGAMKRRK